MIDNNNNNKMMEFRLVSDNTMPPIVITMTETDEPKIVINTTHLIWLSLHRKTIAGSTKPLFEKLDMLLNNFLLEQRANETMYGEDGGI